MSEVAARIFVAAIDEFDGADATHRTPAQSMIRAIARCYGFNPGMVQIVTDPTPSTSAAAMTHVRGGYSVQEPVDGRDLFRAIGFHIAAETMAAREFTLIADTLSRLHPSLVAQLRSTAAFLGSRANAWLWIELHASLEENHACAAIEAVNRALKYYVGRHNFETIRQCIVRGVFSFVQLEEQFFRELSAGVFEESVAV